MTPEEQRIALAEWAGWKYSPDANSSIKHEAIMAWYRPGNSPWQLEQLPDYLNDLNAVHELEEKLTAEQQFEYVYALNEALGLVPLDSPASYREAVLWVFTHSTSAQRCEALLKTLNLWKP